MFFDLDKTLTSHQYACRTGIEAVRELHPGQEGGRVDRMPNELAKTTSARVIGESNDSLLAFEIGAAIADEVGSLGFNLDFAPVLDINSNPNNPVIGDRSFGSDADLVGSLGTQMMKGIASKNVIPVVKHFPGHGDTSVDSHTGLPLVNNGLDRLRTFELLPFRHAIQAGADAVMIAHILFPQIERLNPASLSPFFITDLLRNELGFQGVVFTDDLTMGAIMEHYDIGEAAIRAVKAGANVLLVCHGKDKEVQVIQALKQAALNGSIPAEAVDRSVYRILSLKQKYRLSDEKIDSVDVGGINAVVNGILEKGTP